MDNKRIKMQLKLLIMVLGLGMMENQMDIRRPWGACWMVAEGGEGENPLPFSRTAPIRGGGGGGWGGGGGGG